jgi:hypothetical protein
LQAAFCAHGVGSLKFEVIEVVDDKSTLIEREQFHLDKDQPPWNRAKRAHCSAIPSTLPPASAEDFHPDALTKIEILVPVEAEFLLREYANWLLAFYAKRAATSGR